MKAFVVRATGSEGWEAYLGECDDVLEDPGEVGQPGLGGVRMPVDGSHRPAVGGVAEARRGGRGGVITEL